MKKYRIFHINWEVGHIKTPELWVNGEQIDYDLDFDSEKNALAYARKHSLTYFTILPIYLNQRTMKLNINL